MIRNLLLSLCAAFTLAACHTSFGHRDQTCGPDQRLDTLLDQYDQAKRGEVDALGGGRHLVYDCERIHNEIQRLALEFPRHARILLANGVLAYETREPEKAARYLDDLFEYEPSSPDAAVLRSRIAIDTGNLPAAKRLLATQLSYRPDHAGLHEALASALYLERDFAGARLELALAERLKAPSWRVAYHRGLIAEATGDVEGAQREFQRAHDGNAEFTQAKARLDGARAANGYNASLPPGKSGGG